ncbi:protein C19orf12 homolog [Ciona intestinalis]
MPLRVDDVMQLLSTLAREQNLRVTVTESARGGLMAGAGAFIGGLIGGPVGIAAGAAAGGVLGAATSKSFKPLHEVILALPVTQKQDLANLITNIISGFEPQDAIALIAFVQGSAVLQGQILRTMQEYLTSKAGYQIN